MNPYNSNPARAPLVVEWVPPPRSEVRQVQRALLEHLRRPVSPKPRPKPVQRPAWLE